MGVATPPGRIDVMVIGFLGAGNMAAAMARGWASVDGGPASMLFTDGGSGRAAVLAEEVGGTALASNRDLVDQADVVILAFSPGQLEEVAAELEPPDTVVSLLGATPLERLSEAFPETGIVRLMPNLGVEVGSGVICVAEGGPGSRPGNDRVFAALEKLGKVVTLDDSLMDAATALMGCSPAYFAQVAQALADVGVEEGLPPETAIEIVGESMAGTAELLRRRTPFEIAVAVAHPGGSTEAGLDALEAGGGMDAFRAAAEASLRRMRKE